MKKLTLTLTLILGLAMGAFAQQQDGGLFQYGPSSDYYYGSEYNNYLRNSLILTLPSQHGYTSDTPAPLGGGALLLVGFGAAYAMAKKRKE